MLSLGAKIAVIITAIGSMGCTLLSDFGVEACSSDGDCRLLDGEGLRCKQSRCVPGCTDNRQCAALDPRYPICPEPGATCSGLTSPGGECYLSTDYDDASMGALTGSGMTLVGAFAPSLRSSTWLSLELAVNELNAFDPSSESPTLRPSLVVLCSDVSNELPAAMQHLIQTLGVKGIVASLDDASLDIALSLPRVAGQALFLSPFGVSINSETSSHSHRELWHLGGRHGDIVSAYPTLARRAVDALALADDVPRIASLVGSTAEDRAIADAIEAVATAGGQRVRDLERVGRYRRISVSDASPADRATRLQELVAYGPQLVWVFLGGFFAEPAELERVSVVGELEDALDANGGARPTYLFGPRNFNDAALRRRAASSPSFRQRSIGIDADRSADAMVMGSLAARFAQAFPAIATQDIPLAVSPSVYDALYYMAYAFDYASAPSNGTELSVEMLETGLAQVTDPLGVPVTVGTGSAGLSAAGPSLAGGAPIDLVGTSGPANFDPVLRARPSTPRLYCWQEDGTVQELGKFDAATGGFELADSVSCAQGVLGGP